jgi:hypothetical protein
VIEKHRFWLADVRYLPNNWLGLGRTREHFLIGMAHPIGMCVKAAMAVALESE